MEQESSNKMWETLVSTLKNLIENCENYQLTMVFQMIKKNLAFDNPGLFPNMIIGEEDSLRMEACNIWLFNQLIYILSNNTFFESKGPNLEIQKEIIYASLLKQPWFFYKIVDKYIKFTNTLIISKCNENPLQLTTFQVENYDLQLIAPACSYRTIEIKSDIARCHMIGCCIEILTHLLNMEYDTSVESKITLSVLEAFNSCNFRIKLKCLEYFLQFFEKKRINDGETTVSILTGIITIFELTDLWEKTEVINENELKEFFEIIPKIFYSMKYLDGSIDDSTHKTIVNLMLIILQTCKDTKTCDALISYLEDIFNKNPIDWIDEEICQKIRILIQKIPEQPSCMILLMFGIWYERETNNKLRESIWKETYQMLCREDFKDLKKIEIILKAFEKINNHLSLQLFDNIFIDKIKERIRSSDETTKQKLNVIKYLISSPNFGSVDENFKSEIFIILFDSFSTEKKSIEIILTLEASNLDQNILNRISKILSTVLTAERTNNDIKNYLIEKSPNCLINRLCSTKDFLKNILEPAWNGGNIENHRSLSLVLHEIICLFCNEKIKCEIKCRKCDSEKSSIDTQESVVEQSDLKDFVKNVLTLLRSDNQEIKTNMLRCLVCYFNHFGLDLDLELWTNLLVDKDLKVRDDFSKIMSSIFKAIQLIPDKEYQNQIITKCLQKIRDSIQESLKTPNQTEQSCVLNTIKKFAECDVTEETLVILFKMMFFFMVGSESEVASEASMGAIEICAKHKLTPMNLLNWYKQDIIKFLVSLAVMTYVADGNSFNRSLTHATKTLGFAGPRDFVAKHFKIILAMLLPWCIKYPRSQELIDDVSQIIRKDVAESLSLSFLTIYPYLFLNETTEIINKCIDFIIQNTGSTLYNLLQEDIKKTVAQLLIFYHKNPEFVMQAFRCLLSEDKEYKNTEITLSKMSDYIGKRFLGVLTFFEASVINSENEKSMKIEALLSTGEIMRFLGTAHITSFRFKIIAMLKTALTIEENYLAKVCAEVWTIFIRTVDVQTLGPLLSTIFVSLEPLLKILPDEVNDIFRYLVIANGSILSRYIQELFFLDDTEVCDEVKTVAKKNNAGFKSGTFINRFKDLMKYIDHENLGVRVYGLKYLTRLFVDNRQNLNNLIIGQNTMNPLVEHLLEILMVCCKNPDKNLHLAAGECLGELGAIEPSHLPPNYAPQHNFALSIHTDLFAIIALPELCRAYQFQKDTKFVDSFSLAIQDMLDDRRVNLKTKCKLEVWNSIPEHMQSLMEPLLTSSYTGIKNNKKILVHPVFSTSSNSSCGDWAFVWASKMIENIENEDTTKHLLNSFKPSIKRDTNTLSMFLPYIILHTLQFSQEKCQQEMFEELQTVFESLANENYSNLNTSRLRGVKTVLHAVSDNFITSTTNKSFENSVKCAKLGFQQLDFLEKWMRRWIELNSTVNSDYLNVEKFMKKFDKKFIAKANRSCGEYARALLYLELYIEENPKERLQNELSLLAEIYAELMDPDSLIGAMSLKTAKTTLPEQILAHNVTGQLQESAVCLERTLQIGNIDTADRLELIQCYLTLDQPETALMLTNGLWQQLYENHSEYDLALQEQKAECLWRLSRFDELEDLVKDPLLSESDNWDVKCGQMLISFRNGNFNEIEKRIETTRLSVLKMLGKSGGVEQNSYQKGYQFVIQLHLINEFEKAHKFIKNIQENQSETVLRNLLKEWTYRAELLQPTSRIMEPILCLRRVILMECRNILSDKLPQIEKIIREEIGHSWIKSSELARNAGKFQQSHLYILNAENFSTKELFLEKAKLFWSKNEQSTSLKILNQGLENLLKLNTDIRQLEKSDQKLYAETKLLIATMNAESMNIQIESNVKLFKESVHVFKESEKSFVYLAQYMDKVYASLSENDEKSEKGYEMLSEIMLYYGKSMCYGCHYVYQSMPRFLSIWLDFTATANNHDEQQKKCSTKLTLIASKFCTILPPFIFFTAFSQLVSRICHPCNDVYQVLKTILVTLIKNFPQQSLWMMSSVFKSSYSSRVRRCSEVYQDKRLAEPNMQKLITDFNSFAEKLIELTNSEEPKNQKITVSLLVKSLPKLFLDSNFSKIVIPTEQFFQIMLPPAEQQSDRLSLAGFNAFPNQLTFISGIKEEIVILPSLQRPRRVIFLGTDGKEYFMMLKPRDDMRKDFRLMEFNAVVKQYLHQNPDARERRLNIRTYSVLPLNEECGIIEWVPNLQAARMIINSLYKRKKVAVLTASELKRLALQMLPRDPVAQKREIFLKQLLPRYPSVFSDWFKSRFTTPHNWYQARSSYVRTTAVMSIVGYILGLGDRHGENILYDTTNGDTVHVDFNCLFNKGETFEYPEKVPFRLTHNMVNAMGPLGVEGLFRKCCEITLKVLQEQTPTLMSVLRPFVYDPLVSWGRTKSDGNKERTDIKAMANVKHIEDRLKGFVKTNGKNSNMPLSTEGQVNFVISEAINIDNLASMYLGWAPYM